MSPRRKPHGPLVQLWDLYVVQLTNWRWSWRAMLIVGILSPIVGMIALGVYAKDAGPEALGYVYTGNIVLSLMFENQSKVANNCAYMNAMGTLEFFAALPVSRSLLILATVGAFLTLSLPSLAVVLLVGKCLLGVVLNVHPLVVLVVPLIALPMAGFGAWIGLSVDSPETASAVSIGATVVLVGVGPVVMPSEKIPEIVQWIGLASPAVYAASALRQTLLGPVEARLWIDCLVLSGFSLVTFRLASASMAWRRE